MATGISAARRPGGIPDASTLCSMGPEVSIDHKIILQFSYLPLLRVLRAEPQQRQIRQVIATFGLVDPSSTAQLEGPEIEVGSLLCTPDTVYANPTAKISAEGG